MKPHDEIPSLPLLVAIHQLCCEFESRWQANELPRIEDFVHRCEQPSALRYLALSLLRSELELRTDRGESPSRDVVIVGHSEAGVIYTWTANHGDSDGSRIQSPNRSVGWTVAR